MNTTRNHGFTLVELLVVIAIISVLSTLIMLQLNTARTKARDMKRVSDASQLRSALELYFDDNGSYPADTDMSDLGTLYLGHVPQDPMAPSCTSDYTGLIVGKFTCYGYAWSPATQPFQFQVWVELEIGGTQLMERDVDIDSLSWSGAGVTGSNDTTCDKNVAPDCVYDLGQR